jgi:CubicO group peptidase (beta-lactamase class C family)
MNRSGYDYLYPRKDGNVSRLYKFKDGARIDTDDFHDNAFVLMGGGGMKSTLNDMKKYVAMYLNYGKTADGRRIAGFDAIREMGRIRMNTGINAYYGFGLSIGAMDDLTVVGHGGSLTGVSSRMSFSYEAEAGVMVLCNTSEFGAAEVAEAAMKMLRGRDYVRNGIDYKECEWSGGRLDAVCGEYISGEGGKYIIQRKNGGITINLDGTEYNAVPVNPYSFKIMKGKAVQVFRVFADEGGKVWALGAGLRMVPKSN